jgi:hypothetical protein
MYKREKTRTTSFVWAAGINIVVFVLLWYVFGAIPMPAKPMPASTSNEPGETFGQYTHLIGDQTTDSNVIPEQTTVVAPAPDDTGLETSSTVQPDTSTISTADVETVTGIPSEVWIDEFYLDRGPALSFSPRLNSDGTLRAHPYNPDRIKAPTYEDQRTHFTSDEIILPVMTPARFSKLDLPEELRDFNLVLTVRVNLDARGNLLSDPVIVRSSGHPLVDQMTIEKIKNEASFTNASLIATGEPISLQFHLTVFWVYPVAN